MWDHVQEVLGNSKYISCPFSSSIFFIHLAKWQVPHLFILTHTLHSLCFSSINFWSFLSWNKLIWSTCGIQEGVTGWEDFIQEVDNFYCSIMVHFSVKMHNSAIPLRRVIMSCCFDFNETFPEGRTLWAPLWNTNPSCFIFCRCYVNVKY